MVTPGLKRTWVRRDPSPGPYASRGAMGPEEASLGGFNPKQAEQIRNLVGAIFQGLQQNTPHIIWFAANA